MLIKTVTILFLLTLPLTGFAEGVSVDPVVVDFSSSVGTTRNFEVTVENVGDGNYRFYPTPVGVSGRGRLQEEGEGLAEWIEIDRGRFELEEGESTTLDVAVDIPSGADPGVYYSRVGFPPGGTRSGAEEEVFKRAVPAVLFRLEVEDDRVESAQLLEFSPDRTVFTSSKAELTFRVENVGNVALEPSGELLVYDNRSGRLVDTGPIEEKVIEPGEVGEFEAAVDSGGLGRSRVALDLNYGSRPHEKNIRDVVHFWSFPIWFIAGFFILFFGLLFTLIILLKRLKDST